MPETNPSIPFLYAAITDTQNTIRSLDTKTNYMLVILTIPILKLGQIFSVASKTYSLALSAFPCGAWIFWLMPLLFVTLWILAFLAAFQAISAIDNPQLHIEGDQPEGSFYCGNLFSFGVIDILFKRRTPSKVQFHVHRKHSPEAENVIRDELLFEQMKLVYIRALKMHRSLWAYRFCKSWLAVGFILWISFLILR